MLFGKIELINYCKWEPAADVSAIIFENILAHGASSSSVRSDEFFSKIQL